MPQNSKERVGKIDYNPAIIKQLAEGLYPTYFDAFREYVANAWDADSDKVLIKVSKHGLEIEDFGTGINDLHQFWTVGSPQKSTMELSKIYYRPMVGSKGIGKLSYRKLGSKAEVITRTDKTSAYSTADFSKGEYFVRDYYQIDEALNHRGTKIKITELNRDIDVENVMKYLSKNVYGLVLPITSPNTIKILVNEMKVEPKEVSGRQIKVPTGKGDVTGTLAVSKKGSSIDVLCRGVKVREINPAPTHPVRGYVNVNWLTPLANRNDFDLDSVEYQIFYSAVQNYIKNNFPSEHELLSRRTRQTMHLLSRLMKNVIREMGELPESYSPAKYSEIGSQQIDAMKTGYSDKKKEHEQEKETKPRIPNPEVKDRPIKTDYGIIWNRGYLGPENPAVMFNEIEKIVWFNLDNDYMKRCENLSPKEQSVSYVSLYARGYALAMRKENDFKEFQVFIDTAAAKLLREVTRTI